MQLNIKTDNLFFKFDSTVIINSGGDVNFHIFSKPSQNYRYLMIHFIQPPTNVQLSTVSLLTCFLLQLSQMKIIIKK